MNFLSPLTFFWILSLFAFVFYQLKRLKIVKLLLIINFVLFFIFSVTPIPALLVHHLEKQHYLNYKLKKSDNPTSILILGGGYVNDKKLIVVNQLSNAALGRLAQGVYLYNQFPNCKLVCSGYSQSNQKPIAVVLAESAIAMGTNPKDTITLTRAANTWEEAADYKERFGTSKPFFLVTSAIHMPRVMETFLRFGLKPIPIQADYKVKVDEDKSVYSWKPSWSKIMLSESAFHEYVGIFYYRYFKKIK